MKAIFLIILLTITVICVGQTHKCPKCKLGLVTYHTRNITGYWQCGRCGDLVTVGTAFDLKPVGNSKPQKRLKVNYIPTGGHSTLVNSLVEDDKIIKNDTTKPLNVYGYISAYPVSSGYTLTFKPVKTKVIQV